MKAGRYRAFPSHLSVHCIVRRFVSTARSPLVCVILLGVLAPASFAAIPQIEREALISLYNATNGPGWTDNSNWLGPVGS